MNDNQPAREPSNLFEVRFNLLDHSFKILTDCPDHARLYPETMLGLSTSVAKAAAADIGANGDALFQFRSERLFDRALKALESDGKKADSVKLPFDLEVVCRHDLGACAARLTDEAISTPLRTEPITQARAFVISALSRENVIFLHAAAAAAGGKAALFVGKNGAGKSTSARRLAVEGADFLADDYAPVRFAPDSPPAAAAYPEAINLKDFDEQTRNKLVGGGFRKSPLRDVYWPPCPLKTDWIPVTHIFMPKIKLSGPCKAVPADEKTALLTLMDNIHTPLGGELLGDFLHLMSHLLKTARSFILELGPDRAEIAPAVRSVMF